MKWYGQFDTDKIASEYFPSGYVGTAVDVGACDGEIISNTKAFEDMGWLCLCIEPNPEYWSVLKKTRKHCLKYAVSDSNGMMKLHVFKGPITGHDAVTSLRPDERLVEQYSAKNVYDVDVPVATLDRCIEEFGRFQKIDLVSIDTEGTELDVLKGFNIERWKPSLYIIENNYDDKEIQEFMLSHGFARHRRVVVNDFYEPRAKHSE